MSGALATEQVLSLGSFFAVLAAMALWETLAPRRVLCMPKGKRWAANLGLAALNTMLLRLLFPAAAGGAAALAVDRGWGVLSLLHLPAWAAVPLSIVVLDLAIYLQHVLFHASPTLWRVHRVHHADLDFDVTTGIRFHPIEMILSMLFKLSVVLALGPPVLAVLVFEVLLNASSMFNHGNVRLAVLGDRVLRSVLVTPDMHRVHHSVLRQEENSNFGFCLSWWDRLLGTYRAQPRAGHQGMTIGNADFQDAHHQTLGWLLRSPALDVHPALPDRLGSRSVSHP
jgi:sterol desaturase/sphingolipid hydroxylase (fatty acid hydroxylase superfamily)